MLEKKRENIIEDISKKKKIRKLTNLRNLYLKQLEKLRTTIRLDTDFWSTTIFRSFKKFKKQKEELSIHPNMAYYDVIFGREGHEIVLIQQFSMLIQKCFKLKLIGTGKVWRHNENLKLMINLDNSMVYIKKYHLFI